MRQDPSARVDETAALASSGTDIESSDRETTLREFFATKYVCPVKGCRLQFERQDRLDRHVFSHTNIRKHMCPHEACDKSYATDSHLRRHIRNRHAKKEKAAAEKRIPCEHPDCPQSFTNRTSMMRHMKTKHLEAKPHQCDRCNEAFARKQQLRRHYIKHTGQMPQPCPHCPAAFLNLRQLRHHLVTHQDKRRYECEKCPEVFDKWSNLVAHRRSSHPIACPQCGRKFVKGPCFRKHMASHKETEEVFACVVENCPKYYLDRRNLEAHVRNRHNGQRFECDLCGTRLVTKQKLRMHLDWHMRHPGKQLVRVVAPRTKPSKPRKDKGIRKRTIASLLTNVFESENGLEMIVRTDEVIPPCRVVLKRMKVDEEGVGVETKIANGVESSNESGKTDEVTAPSRVASEQIEVDGPEVGNDSMVDDPSGVWQEIIAREAKIVLQQSGSDKEQEYSSGMEL